MVTEIDATLDRFSLPENPITNPSPKSCWKLKSIPHHPRRQMTVPDTPPKVPSDGPPRAPTHFGRPCPACGSRDTGREELLHRKPGVLWFLLFGWLFLLTRSAFSRRIDTCRDCGEIFRYRTVGSWIALAVVVIWIFVVIDYLWFYTQRT